jgi:NAD(P)-dependent dehydrogenase (short-subunit alcohol dehydrogenase family)
MGLDPDDLELCLRVLADAELLPPEHPDAIAVRRATASLFKAVKQRRRVERREAVLANDMAVTSATATGAPGRIDDETRGAPLTSNGNGASAGTLLKARGCYVCKQRFVEVDHFYHQLCPDCARLNHAKRDARTDLTGRRALLTGGRAKIGLHIALRLLRDGADTTITTRFPRDAARRFAELPDSGDWLDRLRIVGLDLRDPAQVVELADTMAGHGSLDILINNAAQTVRRSPDAYAPLTRAESAPLPGGPLLEVLTIGRARLHGAAAQELVTGSPRVALEAGVDAAGLLPDLAAVNSWVQGVGEVDALELLEVQLCNSIAPFILVDRLRPALAASPARRTYVVNVSAMEGQFNRGYKGAGHPHTNMAKAALNMLTRTSAHDLLGDGILMTSVDTGWITDERPHPTRMRLAEDGFHAPLDLIDGAARVYDPIVRGEAGEDVYGCFLKDYSPAPW